MHGYKSKRLKFRDILESDFDNLFSLYGDAESMTYIANGRALSEAQCRDKLAQLLKEKDEVNSFGIWAAELLQSGEFIGWFLLKKFPGIVEPGLGYSLIKKFRGSGLAREGANAVIEYVSRNTNIELLSAITSPQNVKSIALLIDLNFFFDKCIAYQNPVAFEKESLNLYLKKLKSL